MFYSRKKMEAKLADSLGDEERSELEALRKDKQARQEAERVEADKKRKEEYAKREWVNEGKGTGIQSLVIEGGKLWRIKEEIYFMPTQTTTTYLAGLGGCYNSHTTFGTLTRL